jgi:predicted dehydrogenase
MLRVGIVGCGKIADAHVTQIQQLDGCEIVGVCDRDLLMAKQLHDRFAIKQYFTEISELVACTRPQVVHITTPPASHFEIARFCLLSGCHIYIEKPFTLDAEEARRLVNLANERGLKLTVGHNYQFSHAAQRMRALVNSGYLGGHPVHMESHYGYDLTNPSYAKALLGDGNHWVRKLPGGLLHNIISHGIARVSEFLRTDTPQVIAHGFVSPILKGISEYEIVDELRVIISEEERTTAYFTFSSQMRPSLHEFRVYGQQNGLYLDQSHEILLKMRGTKFKSYADHFVPPVVFAKQHLRELVGNMKLFLGRNFHMDYGMKSLIEAFYASILYDVPVPIPSREIILTATIMDSIFDQLNTKRLMVHSSSDEGSVGLGEMTARV